MNVIAGGGNTSYKSADTLWVKASGAALATIGMRTRNLPMRTWYGAPMYFLLGAVHALFFWVLSSALTPLILLVTLFNSRRRTLHDYLTGSVMINDEARAVSLRRK